MSNKAETLFLAIDARRAQAGARQFEQAARGVGGAASSAQRLIMGLAGSISAAFAVRQIYRDIAQFETGLVGVGKTTNMLGRELDALGQSVINLSTVIPVSTSELLEIGQAAGQLGVTGADNILKFTDTVAKLGTASDLAGEEAATVLARMLNVTGEAVGTVDTLASVIVALGNTSAATEKEIAHHATMVAQATAVYNTSSAEASALGAALAALGMRAELGGSSVGRAYRAMDAAIRGHGQELKLLAEITGQTGDEITETFKNNSTEAFQLFLKGLDRVIDSGGDVNRVLAAFGLQGEEILKTLPTLAKNYDLVSKSLKTARGELENTTALETEASRAFGTLESKVKIFGNTISAIILKLRKSTGPLAEFVGNATEATKILFGLKDESKETSDSVLIMTKSIKAATAALAVFMAVRAIGHIYTLIAAVGGLTGAFKALAITISANPIGLIAVGITAAVAALIYFKDEVITIGDKTMSVGDICVATWEYIREVAAYTFKNIVEFGVWFKDSVIDAWKLLSKAWQKLTKFLGIDWEQVVNFLWDTIKTWGNAVEGIFRGLIGTIKVLFNIMKDTVMAWAEFDINSPIDSLGKVKDALAEAMDPSKAVEKIKDVWADAMSHDYIGNSIKFGKLGAQSVVDGWKEFMGDQGYKEWERLFNPSKVVTGILDRASSMKQERDATLAQQEFEKNILGMWDKAKNAAQGYWNKVKELMGGGSNSATSSSVSNNNIYNPEAEKIIERLNQELKLLGMTTDAQGRYRLELELIEAGLIKGTAAYDKYYGQLEKLYEQLEQSKEIKQFADNMGQAFGDAFLDMATGAKSASDAIRDLTQSIARMVLQETVGNKISGLISNGIQGLFSPSTTSTNNASATSGMGDYYFPQNGPVANALGNIFDRGQVVPFADGGIFDQPTYFPMSGRRTGLMGEAGPEGVLPLSRSYDGKLGVQARVPDVNMQINVVNESSQPVTAEQGSIEFDGEKFVKTIILKDLSENGSLRKAFKGLR